MRFVVAVFLGFLFASVGGFAQAPGGTEGEPEPGDLRTFADIEMVWIPPGSFMMGSPADEEGRDDNEGPQHRVTLSKGFWFGKYEVTKRQWTKVIPWRNKPRVIEDPDSPAVYVSWDMAQEFITALNKETFGGWRLPTEAEWEYACRAGSTTRFHYGDDPAYTGLSRYDWYSTNATESGRAYAHVAGLRRSNAWGLYDLHGNVWEWCQDWFGNYADTPETDPRGPEKGAYRIGRGGSYDRNGRYCRSAQRNYGNPGDTGSDIGFRLVWRGK